MHERRVARLGLGVKRLADAPLEVLRRRGRGLARRQLGAVLLSEACDVPLLRQRDRARRDVLLDLGPEHRGHVADEPLVDPHVLGLQRAEHVGVLHVRRLKMDEPIGGEPGDGPRVAVAPHVQARVGDAPSEAHAALGTRLGQVAVDLLVPSANGVCVSV